MAESSIESQAERSGGLILPGSILTWLGVWAALRFGVTPPIPGSVMNLYMAIVTVSVLVYVVADQDRSRRFVAPIVSLLRERRLLAPRIAVLVSLPLLLGWITYTGVRPQFDPPFEARTIHPEPPATFKLHGQDFDVLKARRPPGMEVNEENLAAGSRLYYRNAAADGFDEISKEVGVNAVGWAFAPAMVDVDGDGLLDLYATSGYLSYDRNAGDG